MKFVKTVVLAGLMSGILGGAAIAGGVKHLDTGKIYPQKLPVSEMVVAGDTLYLSGQIGNKPGTVKLVEGGMEAEAKQIMENIKANLENHGYSMANLVKCTALLADITEWGTFNGIYKEYFEDGKYPARTAFEASGIPLGARLEVECIGAK
ncbi:MAG: RidA family protein [Pseudomonadota bacterium]